MASGMDSGAADGLRDLYQSVIIDHSKRPRNFKSLAAATHTGVGHNPLCGDRVTLYLTVENGRVKDVAFEGSGCAISTASASLMTEFLKSKTLGEVEALFQKFHDLITSPPDAPAPDVPELGKLQVLAGVREFAARVKCASLPWHTLRAAIQGGEVTAKTE